MSETLTLRYDKIGDILYIDRVKPYAEQESEEIDDGVVARLNPTTSKIETVEILWFFQRIGDQSLSELPIICKMKFGDRLA